MKRTIKYLVGIGAATVLSAGAFVGTAVTDERAGDAARQHERGHVELAQAGGPRGRIQRAQSVPQSGLWHGRFGERILELFDGDKDGKLTQAEIDKARADQHGKFDTDNDGSLNLREYEALWLDAMRERMVDAFQRHDDDGDAQVTAEEFQERFKNFVARSDRNEDGVFSRNDIRSRQQ